MKKEVFIAILSGLILGLIVTFGIYTANQSLEKQKAKKAAETQTSPTATPSLNDLQKTLEITSHENFDLIDQSEITLAGVAWPNAVIALMTENDNLFTTTDEQGDFVFTFNLIKGYNEITIIATDEANSTQTKDLILTYSTSKIELEAAASPQTQE